MKLQQQITQDLKSSQMVSAAISQNRFETIDGFLYRNCNAMQWLSSVQKFLHFQNAFPRLCLSWKT
jgi:hypothetical protein